MTKIKNEIWEKITSSMKNTHWKRKMVKELLIDNAELREVIDQIPLKVKLNNKEIEIYQIEEGVLIKCNDGIFWEQVKVDSKTGEYLRESYESGIKPEKINEVEFFDESESSENIENKNLGKLIMEIEEIIFKGEFFI